jgi:hypothetical protein
VKLAPGPGLVVLLLIAAGCNLSGTKEYKGTGPVGTTFSGPGGLKATLVKYLPDVKPPAHDVTGLSTPKPGTHLAGFRVKLCIDTTGLPTISERNFSVPLEGGGEAEVKFPQTVLSPDLDLLGEPGCEEGHVVFQVPAGTKPTDLRFAMDIRKGDVQGYTDKTNVRFDWTL